MGKIIICALLTGLAAPVLADSSCAKYGEMASVILETRYSGASMSQIMGIMEESFNGQAERAAARDLVIAAYEVPAFVSAKAQARAVRQFRDEAELECYKSGAN